MLELYRLLPNGQNCMNVSPNFSPPISLMKPYFLLSGVFYILSFTLAFLLSPSLNLQNFSLLAWVHLYMLGFVMLSIFAAMAQLAPVVIESNHYNVSIFRYLHIILVIGLSGMLIGFFYTPIFLIYGGNFVLLSMVLYAGEFLITLSNAKRKTSITKAMRMSNFFLLVGIITGLVMTAAFNGHISLNPQKILNIHTFGLIVGFVILLIMGISIILLPMFGTAKRISDNEFSASFITISLGVVTMMLSPFFYTKVLQNFSYTLTTVAIVLYLYQLYKISSSRARINHDIWAKSMYVAFSAFIISFSLLCSYLFTDNELFLRAGTWLLMVGFFGTLIIGNFYKIIPFLVWFHIYSPLIEERSVPMLHELLDNRIAHLQWFYTTLGIILSTYALFTQESSLFQGATLLLVIGGLIFFITIYKILKVKI